MYRYRYFSKCASSIAHIAGHPLTFVFVGLALLGWGIAGPMVNFSELWITSFSLFISLVAFFLLFVIQHTQNRETTAIHLKLNELIRAHEGAYNALLDIEELADRDLDQIKSGYKEVAEQAREELRCGKSAAATAVAEVRSLNYLYETEAILSDPARLAALYELNLLDTPPEAPFERLTHAAKIALHVPVALLSLVDVDRQFFKSCTGLEEPWASARQTPLSHSFCQYAVTSREPLIIHDARNNPLVASNKAVKELGVIAYCGIPLIRKDGSAIGSFCVIDSKPRLWQPEEVEFLEDLASVVMDEMELRYGMLKS